MAKKVVASLQKKDSKSFTKCIKFIKSDKSGAYTFQEEIVHADNQKQFFAD